MSKVLTRFIIPGRREASCFQHLCGVRGPDNGETEPGREKARTSNSYPAQGKEIRMIDFFRKGAMYRELLDPRKRKGERGGKRCLNNNKGTQEAVMLCQ